MTQPAISIRSLLVAPIQMHTFFNSKRISKSLQLGYLPKPILHGKVHTTIFGLHLTTLPQHLVLGLFELWCKIFCSPTPDISLLDISLLASPTLHNNNKNNNSTLPNVFPLPPKLPPYYYPISSTCKRIFLLEAAPCTKCRCQTKSATLFS